MPQVRPTSKASSDHFGIVHAGVPVDLLLAVRTVAAGAELIGADVVEVIPTAVATDDYSALVAERVVRETLTGLALRRRAR